MKKKSTARLISITLRLDEEMSENLAKAQERLDRFKSEMVEFEKAYTRFNKTINDNK